MTKRQVQAPTEYEVAVSVASPRPPIAAAPDLARLLPLLDVPVPLLILAGPALECRANAAAAALLPDGVDAASLEAAAQRWQAAWPGFLDDVREVLDGAPLSVRRCLLRRPGAASLPVVRTVTALRDSDALTGLLVQILPIQDDSAERAARAALVASEERLRLGLEAGRMVTWEYDLNRGELTCSPNLEQIFGSGASAGEFVARMPAEDADEDQRRLQQAVADPAGIYQSEFRYLHPAGHVMHLQNWGKVMRDAAGQPLRVHGVCMDITERKHAEIALKQLNETLEQEVEKRTQALMQAEHALRQSQKVEALGHLTGGIAHDFNNLLGTMLGNFDLIARRPDDPARVRDLAQAGLRAADRGTRLIGQLLTFSRTQQIELEPVRLGQVLEGMSDLLQSTLGARIEVAISDGCAGSYVLSDATQLEMAVLNLAINARDAMPDGGLLSIASARRSLAHDPQLPSGDYVELTVADTGTGMSDDVAARAFDPFFTTKTIGKGTGLGLSQVYGIARQAGGAARIRSAPGRGTTVTLLLPVTDLPPAAAAPASNPAPSHRPRETKVLVVDDDPDLRQVLAMSLEDLGYCPIEAESGAAALDLLAAAAPDIMPDVMIADFAMPGMTGAELARAVRRVSPGLPIILASGYAETPSLEALPGPRTRTLRKPFRVDELRDALAAALAGR